jgi:hypothetical protein
MIGCDNAPLAVTSMFPRVQLLHVFFLTSE